MCPRGHHPCYAAALQETHDMKILLQTEAHRGASGACRKTPCWPSPRHGKPAHSRLKPICHYWPTAGLPYSMIARSDAPSRGRLARLSDQRRDRHDGCRSLARPGIRRRDGSASEDLLHWQADTGMRFNLEMKCHGARQGEAASALARSWPVSSRDSIWSLPSMPRSLRPCKPPFPQCRAPDQRGVAGRLAGTRRKARARGAASGQGYRDARDGRGHPFRRASGQGLDRE